ncbi:hypothetical protein Tco_0235814 [Tanacetum coccineum]
MSLPPLVSNFKDPANRVPVSRFRTGAYHVPCDYGSEGQPETIVEDIEKMVRAMDTWPVKWVLYISQNFCPSASVVNKEDELTEKMNHEGGNKDNTLHIVQESNWTTDYEAAGEQFCVTTLGDDKELVVIGEIGGVLLGGGDGGDFVSKVQE